MASCHGINPFAADLGRTDLGGRPIRAPYLSQCTYLGHFDLNGEASKDDRADQRAVYFWLPESTPELGVRFVSGKLGAVPFDPDQDVAEPAYLSHKHDTLSFDPAIELQRCVTALELEDVAAPCAQWVSLGSNDDSVEMPVGHEGKLTNSLLRVSTVMDDPLKILARGLYRVQISASKQTVLRGNFMLQLGAPILLDTVAMARSADPLPDLVRAHAPHHGGGPGAALHPQDGLALPLEANDPERP